MVGHEDGEVQLHPYSPLVFGIASAARRPPVWRRTVGRVPWEGAFSAGDDRIYTVADAAGYRVCGDRDCWRAASASDDMCDRSLLI
jgi:hypothetical protein